MAIDYSGINDAEFLDFDAKAKKLRDALAEKKKAFDARMKEYEAWKAGPAWDSEGNQGGYFPGNGTDTKWIEQLNALDAEMVALSGEASTLETKRDNRGALVTQGGVNTQAGTAASEAIKNENLLAQNIGQEIQGRIARNNQQATEAKASVNILSEATRGRQAAKAGQAGYGMASGTAGALADASASKSAEDQAAIESYRVGRQNLLMGQGEAAAKSALDLSGTINTITDDWSTKSAAALTDVTGTLLKNVETVVKMPSFSGDIQAAPGIKPAQEAVDSTLGTWSFDKYMETLNTLTGHSSNKSTWDSMLLDLKSAPENPYGSADSAISPLTPVAGTQSNLLAAAAGAPSQDVYSMNLSGKKSKGSLL
jgi:hypothetical protein